MDVCAAFVADTESAVLVQPGDRALDDPALLTEPGAVWLLRSWDRGADPAGPQLASVAAGVVPSPSSRRGRRRGRPRLPRTGGIASTSGSSSRMSLWFPALSESASGVPRPQVTVWCLEPLRARSTGLGPVFSPPQRRVRASYRSPPATSRSGRPRAALRAAAHAAVARRLVPATP